MASSSWSHDSVGQSSGTGRFTCHHHAEEGKQPHPDDRNMFQIQSSIMKLYDEAVRRLPIQEIPELVGCIFQGGHCYGLADPVSNIVLNAIAHHASGREAPLLSLPQEEGKSLWRIIASRSYSGLVAFMTAYFRYLSDDQAKRYLYIASHDLPVAIKLVHHDRRQSKLTRPRLLPDGGKIKTALRVAALKATHPAPDQLASLMTAQFPAGQLSPILTKLQGSELLTTGDVNIDFLRRPNGLGLDRVQGGQRLTLRTNIGEQGRVALITVSGDDAILDSAIQLGYISDLTFDGESIATKLSNCLVGVPPPLDKGDKAAGAGASPNYDLSPCNHIISLRMCLLDAIHGFYIRALTSLPAGDAWKRKQGRFAAASSAPSSLQDIAMALWTLCPTSSTVWYDINFPPPSHEVGGDSEFELPGDIFDTSAMSRVESRSLDGLVAALCAISKPISKHEALEYLWSMECSLIEILLRDKETKTKDNAFTEATKASNHPKGSMFGSFLTSLSSQNLEDMRECLFISSSGDVWDQLYRTIKNICRPKRKRQSLATATVAHTLPGISKMWSAFVARQRFVRTTLEELLDGYGKQHPWEPCYKLDLICGLEEPASFHCKMYHANFLASTQLDAMMTDDATTTTPVRRLFFAQFWKVEPRARIFGKPKVDICCPIQDITCFGRCTYCESRASNIVHPPYGDDDTTDIDGYLYPTTLRRLGFKKEAVLESDFIYLFDHEEDEKVAEILR
uniref:Uncharacterized protein n=1 Tax=Oryza punctata TaxID=4537 RepID=A0A0E0LEF0_ORYPU